MFSGCNNLISLDISSFRTPELYTIEKMFYQCKSLTSIDISNFDTSRVVSMRATFSGCSNLETIAVNLPVIRPPKKCILKNL